MEVPEFRESLDLTLKLMRKLIHLDTSLQVNGRFVELFQNLLRHWSRKVRMSNPIAVEFEIFEVSPQSLLFTGESEAEGPWAGSPDGGK